MRPVNDDRGPTNVRDAVKKAGGLFRRKMFFACFFGRVTFLEGDAVLERKKTRPGPMAVRVRFF